MTRVSRDSWQVGCRRKFAKMWCKLEMVKCALKVAPYCCNQRISKGAALTFRANALHCTLFTAPQPFGESFESICRRISVMLATKEITRRLLVQHPPPPASTFQPVREYTVSPSNQRLPGGCQLVSVCVTEAKEVYVFFLKISVKCDLV